MLRLLARLLIGGPYGQHIRSDLEELYARDAVRMSRGRALIRYARNLLGSAATTWRARLPRRDLPGISTLDFKLGVRMLVRFPGLTIMAGLSLAFAIWVGACVFEGLGQIVSPVLPLPDGDRVVGLRQWDAEAGAQERHIVHDFETWRDELETVTDVGAVRQVQRNLIPAEGHGEPVVVAEMSAAGFRVAGIGPLLGRPLLEDDERPGAPLVAVIGHEVWQRRFGGGADVIGQTARLGREPVTIVGVMPEGFGFPVAHQVWVPLRLNGLDHERRQGPSLQVFGRLAEGASLADAQAELDALGRNAAADFPDTHANLRPQVLPYVQSILDLSGMVRALLYSFNLPIVLLLLLICSNVALLLFARAATRENEMVVRNALGASRGRIVTQLCAEALVLGVLATAIGLSLAGHGLRWFLDAVAVEFLNGNRVPFWIHDRLSPSAYVYALGLTLLCALVAGAVPALKVTRGLGTRLRQASSGGGGFRFGGFWTFVVIAQIAITVVLPLLTFAVHLESRRMTRVDPGFVMEDYLTVRVALDPEEIGPSVGDTSLAAYRAHVRATATELERRLSSHAAVEGVTFAERLPLMYHPYRLIELDAGGGAPLRPEWPGYRVSSASVDLDFFDVFAAPILAGRGFHAGDLEPDARAVIVNESFVRLVLGGRNAVGRHLRYTHMEEWAEPRDTDGLPWYEIVGVVPDLVMAYGDGSGSSDPKVAGLYHPAAPASLAPLHLAVHVPGGAARFAPELRRMAAAADPALRLYDVMTADDITQQDAQLYRFWIGLLAMLTAVALTLSLAGIYSVMAFTVSQRTREIGIRVALGASRPRIVRATLARPFVQVVLGIATGMLLLGVVTWSVGGSVPLSVVPQLVGYALLMLAVCLLAAVVPTRRVLSVEPGEALRIEG